MTQEERCQSLPHTPATKEDLAAYRRGIITGVMVSATPNVVGSLIAAIEQAQIERGEYICQKCGLRKDGEAVDADF